MAPNTSGVDSGEESYEEREAVAVFGDEQSLNSAVEDLLQIGLRQEDMSVLAHGKRLQETGLASAEQLADSAATPRAAYVGPNERQEGAAAIACTPALLAGLGAAAIVGTAGAALIPTLAAAVGSTAAAGALGGLLARAFGRKHAEFVTNQIMNGGLLLWVRAPDASKDAEIVGILKKNGGSDIHIHVITRTWGVADVPLHDVNPDPLLG